MTPRERAEAMGWVQLVEHPRWRWGPGMRVIATRPFSGGELRLGRLNTRPYGLVVAWDDGSYWSPSADDLTAWALDLTDPATAGVLLGWLAETGRWSWENYGGQHAVWNTDAMEGEVFRSRVFGEAVARALLAVWGPA